MYKNHSNLETIFRIIDTDHSGQKPLQHGSDSLLYNFNPFPYLFWPVHTVTHLPFYYLTGWAKTPQPVKPQRYF